jgi:L-aminopeptidase/D-esterase-like protein
MTEESLVKSTDIRNIQGIHIGHAQDLEAATGCTVIICEEGAVAGVDVRGGSPSTRETDGLSLVSLRQKIHAVLLAGGSAFGLDAAAGVMQYLEERGVGRDVQVTKVPIVCGAILFDLLCGSYKVRPDREMGYAACQNAYHFSLQKNRTSTAYAIAEGSIGAGTGATIGKSKGSEYAMKGGLGICCLQIGELLVGAIIAVNCVGDVYDPGTGKIVAGVLNDDKKTVGNSERILLQNYADHKDFFSGNTVIGTILTNAKLDKVQAAKVAASGQDGIARCIRPAHSIYDGDTIFVMATGKIDAHLDAVSILAAKAVEGAILRAVSEAKGLCGYVSESDLSGRA